MKRLSRADRWLGVATSVLILGMITGVMGLQSARVRSHIPYLNAPVPTATPAGVVIKLDQLPAANVAAPVADVGTEPAQPAVDVAPTVAPTVAATATTAPALVAQTTLTATSTLVPTVAPTATAAPAAATIAPTPKPQAIAPATFLEPMSHWFQGWNQCAEESIAMAVSYFGIKLDPNAVTTFLRPNNGVKGSKNVESNRIVDYLRGQGVQAEAYQGGTVDRVKQLVASGVPVIVGQWQNRTDHAGIGHWRVVRGYDDGKGVFLINDSMEGAAVPISYAEFDDLWPVYNYVYIPVWNDKLAPSVQRVMGDDMNLKVNIAHDIAYVQNRIEQQPTNAELYLALGGGYFKDGDYQKAVDAYHKARSMGMIQKYPWTLWYQSWPVTAMVNLGMNDEALQVSQENIKSAGVFAIMHYERGIVYEKQGDIATAKREYQMALVDDKNYPDAQAAMKRLGG
ncbi:MAG: C39 family peptidase, partial [Thermomicrobiales bacterium]